MRRRIVAIAVLAAAAMAIAPAAYAKGPAGATIEGDGIDGTLVVDQPGELGQGTPMSHLVEAAGFFELTFGGAPGVSAEAPPGDLGSRSLVMTWDMGAGDGLVQEIYLHAEGGPVGHMDAGQEFWEDTATTVGGWFPITGDIATPLTGLGVPEEVFATATTKDPAAAAEQPPADVAAGPELAKASASGTTLEDTEATARPVSQEPTVGSQLTTQRGLGSAITVAVVAVLLAAAIIGTTAWIRQRRPMPH